MSLVYGNLIAETANALGQGPFTLNGAFSTEYSPWSAKVQVGSKTVYTAKQGDLFEVGWGVLAAADQLTRAYVYDSTDSSAYVDGSPTTRVKVSFDPGTDILIYNDVPAQLFISVDENGIVVDPTPFRGAIFLDTVTDMQAQDGLVDGETMIVTESETVTGVIREPGIFRFDAADATLPDGIDTFRNNNYATGLHKRVKIQVQGTFKGSSTIDASAANAGARQYLFGNPKATNPNDWFSHFVDTAAGAFRITGRFNQGADKNLLSLFSLGTNSDRVELNVPMRMASTTDTTGLKARTLIRTASSLAFTIGDAVSDAVKALFKKIPLTFGGYYSAVVPTIAMLNGIGSDVDGAGTAAYGPAELFTDGEIMLVLGRDAAGDCRPFTVKWVAASTTAADDVTVFRPIYGAAATGAGRFLLQVSNVDTTFTSGDATPSVKHALFCYTAGSTAVTNLTKGYEGQVVVIERGNADITFVHDPAKLSLGGSNVTLTTLSPRLMLINIGGVWKSLGGQSQIDDSILKTLTTRGPSQAAVFRAISFLDLRDFFVGSLAYVSGYTTTTYAGRQAASDITTALQAAITEASSRLSAAARFIFVMIPAGLYTLSTSITLANGVIVQGAGCGIYSTDTHLRRIGDYGDTFVGNPGVYVPGTFVSNCGLSRMRIYQDHGGNAMWGYFNPAVGSFSNKATTGSHINLQFPKDVTISDLSVWGLPTSLSVLGGSDLKLNNCDLHGIWDVLSATRQEGVNSVLIDGDLTNGLPTSFDFRNVTISGDKATGVNVTYPGGNVFNTVLNQGFKRGLVIKCLEESRFSSVYIQGMAQSDVVFSSKPNSIIQGLKFSNCGFDPCGPLAGDAAILFEDAGITSSVPTALSFTSCQILFQGNGYIGISDIGSTAGRYSVNSMQWAGGEMSTFVGVAVHLECASHVSIVGTSIRAFNNNAYYSGDDACGVYVGANCRVVTVNGCTIGGTSAGATSGSGCVDGVRAANAVTSRVKVIGCVNGGLLGSLFTSGGAAVTGDGNPGAEAQGNSDFTLTYGSSAPLQWVIGSFTANRTCTLAGTDAYGGTIPNGAEFTITWDNATARGYSISIGGIATLYPGFVCTVFWYAGAWRLKSLTLGSRQTTQTASTTTGSTITIANTTESQHIGAGGTLAALTVAVPANPYPGQPLTVSFGIAITALTWTGSFQNAPATAATAGQVFRFRYDSATNLWWND